jgi:hypothetical protein
MNYNLYPFSAPMIMTDAIFELYGGHTGTTVASQRQGAYLIAEKIASDDIGTLLTQHIVTGTFIFNPLRPIILDYGYVDRIIETRFIQKDEVTYLTVQGVNNEYVALLDDERGEVKVFNVTRWQPPSYPYKVQIVYNCGIPSGTNYRPDVLLGLTTYSDIILNEIQGYGNEAPGDVGVKDFRSINRYSEARVALIRTSFGTSARAQFISKMFRNLRKNRWVGL